MCTLCLVGMRLLRDQRHRMEPVRLSQLKQRLDKCHEFHNCTPMTTSLHNSQIREATRLSPKNNQSSHNPSIITFVPMIALQQRHHRRNRNQNSQKTHRTIQKRRSHRARRRHRRRRRRPRLRVINTPRLTRLSERVVDIER